MSEPSEIDETATGVELVDEPLDDSFHDSPFPDVEITGSPVAIHHPGALAVAMAVFLWVLVLGGVSLLILQWVDWG